jgi:hypothetical protein
MVFVLIILASAVSQVRSDRDENDAEHRRTRTAVEPATPPIGPIYRGSTNRNAAALRNNRKAARSFQLRTTAGTAAGLRKNQF